MTDIFKLTPDQERAFEIFKKGKSMCITGPAGCGKSYLINYIRQQCATKHFSVAVTALTGAAATLVNGQTLHGWGGLGLAQHSSEKIARFIKGGRPDVMKRWRSTNVLIIDEISMMSAELFNKVSNVAKILRGTNRFFGGIQVVLCGDFAQLEPINADKFCFESAEWQHHIASNTVYINKIMRQSDPEFLKMLSEIRLGKVSQHTKDLLSSRVVKDHSIAEIEIKGSGQKIMPTKLFPHKKDVNHINLDELGALVESGMQYDNYTAVDHLINKKTGDSKVLDEDESERLDKLCQVPRYTQLAIGAQVMLVVNMDFEKGLVNGSRGVIMDFHGGQPLVVFDNGEEMVISRHRFEMESGNKLYTRLQVPLILAWALTIHKCQGATLTNVIADLSKVFCNAQSYVTLSRVKNLEGLYLTGIRFSGIKCHQRVLNYYKQLELKQLDDSAKSAKSANSDIKTD